MVMGICDNCLAYTDSSVSEWEFVRSSKPACKDHTRIVIKKCFAEYDANSKEWSKGCSYDEATPEQKKAADEVINQ